MPISRHCSKYQIFFSFPTKNPNRISPTKALVNHFIRLDFSFKQYVVIFDSDAQLSWLPYSVKTIVLTISTCEFQFVLI